MLKRMKNTKAGFTLIELLVVIAIIGILSSVVLASLNTARDKGQDAAAKANLSNMRAQAELFYDGDGNLSYSGVCDSTVVENAVDAAGGTCFDESETGISEGWAAEAPLSTGYFCVDYSGNATTVDGTTISATDVVCD
jgi:prepilin-type N-terminal cleavage/methylation domain-containing protein